MNYKNLFGRLNSLESFLYEEDDDDAQEKDLGDEGQEVDNANDQGYNDQEAEDNDIDEEYVDSFVNKLDLIVTRIDGVSSFIKDGDADAALIAFEKIIEDSISIYYEMGGEGNALSKIKNKAEKLDKNASNKKKQGGGSNGDGKKKDKKKKDKKKKDDAGGTEVKSPNDSGVQESLDLSKQDVGYDINSNYGHISENRNDPFGIPGLVNDVMRRSGIK